MMFITMMSLLKLEVVLVLVVLIGLTRAAGIKKADRSIITYNNSGTRVEMYWMDVNTGGRALMTDPDILAGADFQMNSFVAHTFEIRELPSKKTGRCILEECRTASFTVNENENQFVTLDEDFVIDHTDHTTEALDDAGKILSACKNNAIRDLEATANTIAPDQVVQRMANCMKEAVTKQLQEVAEVATNEAVVRKKMGASYENYTCMDFELESSEPIEKTRWTDPKTGHFKDVGIMIDRPSSKIHVIDDFITEEECDAMEQSAQSTLAKAVVADGAGGHRESENRKAMQAGITVPWDKEHEKNPITTISRRVYDYVNHAMNLSIDEHGQESLMSIQYFAQNKTGDNLKYDDYDQYFPHCDGDCTGDHHMVPGRVATMVVYCKVPAKGGATNFRNSGLHIKAKKGSGVFFSYYDPETGLMDNGFTEHSGCPVVEGEKKIVTQWVRLGVTADVPWNAYNSLGILLSKVSEQDES